MANLIRYSQKVSRNSIDLIAGRCIADDQAVKVVEVYKSFARVHLGSQITRHHHNSEAFPEPRVIAHRNHPIALYWKSPLVYSTAQL